MLSHRRQEIGEVTRPLSGDVGVRKVVALHPSDEAAVGPEHSVDDHMGVRCGATGSVDRIIPVSVSRGHDDEYSTRNRRVAQNFQHVQGSTTPTDRVVPEHRRQQRPTVTEFNPTIKCFLSAQIQVMPDPSGVSVSLDVERQPFDPLNWGQHPAGRRPGKRIHSHLDFPGKPKPSRARLTAAHRPRRSRSTCLPTR